MEDRIKYYKPKIEDLHIGFEYELKQEDDDYNTWWEKNTAEENVGAVLNSLIKSGCVRVKKLDLEDIISLGWEQSIDEPDEWFWGFKGDKDIQLYIGTIPQKGNFEGIVIYYGTEVLFKGYPRNKNELLDVMTLINLSA